MSVLYFGGVWPPGIEGFNILLNIPVSMKNRNIKEYRGGSSTQKVPPPGGICHSVFLQGHRMPISHPNATVCIW